MIRTRTLTALALAVLVPCILALTGCPEQAPVDDSVATPVEEAPQISEVEQPKPAPDFKVTLVRGGEVSLSDYAGKILVLDFWATWCVGCVEELPHYQELYESWDQDEVEYLGLSLDGDASTVEAFLKGRPELTLPMAIVPDAVVEAYIPRRTLPSSRVIDRDGKVRYEFTGPGSKKVAEAVQRLLAEEDDM